MDDLSAALNGFVPAARDILDISAPEEPEARLPAPAGGNHGRPSTYNKATANAICERVAQGEPVRRICRDDEMPHRATVYRWLAEREEFQAAYALAMQCRIDDMADECLEIADDGSHDLTLDPGDGENTMPALVVDKEVLARTKIRLAERHWWLACMAPRKYGRNVDLDSPPTAQGGDGAKEINPNGEKPPTVLDEHPLGAALRAWGNVGTEA